MIVERMSDMWEDLLFQRNLSKQLPKVNMQDKQFLYRCRSGRLDSEELKRIILFVQAMEKKNSVWRLPVVFFMGEVTPADKLSYILFEYICYYLINVKKYKCFVLIRYKCDIITSGAQYSAINLLGRNSLHMKKDRSAEFIKRFKNSIEIMHYRTILNGEEYDTDKPSKIETNIHSILEHLNIETVAIKEITSVIGELLVNAGEHTGTDCLVDVDITGEYIKNNAATNEKYYGVNIAIFNISNEMLGDGIKRILDEVEDLNEWYEKLKIAKNKHSVFWNEEYSERDFFILSAFQHRISSRKDNYVTGGTGLTRLIAALEDRSDAYDCYALAGKRRINFNHEYLKLDASDWVGFNKQNDFVNYPPERSIITENTFFFPGTAYNLNFVLKKEE